MFEEDFERCFICQQPCKGLYCSSECRLQDKGTPAESRKQPAPIRLTARLPDALSPLVRATHHISPSPVMPAHTDTSSISSRSSSPLNSPRTIPSGADSPPAQMFNLPPPAFPSQSPAFSGSIPVKIPAMLARSGRPPIGSPAVGAHTPASHGSTIHPATAAAGTSIGTLHFGRKPSVTNSVTSPNALLPRCACGKPANHRSRPSSKERVSNEFDSGFSRLSLGPPAHRTTYLDKRHASETHAHDLLHSQAQSGHSTPTVALSSSYLSRSRSDPAPNSPKHGKRPAVIAPPTAREASLITPTSRRASAIEAGRPLFNSSTAMSRSGSAQDPAADGARGRSRDRLVRPRESTAPGLLNHPPEREVAPSRSRQRATSPVEQLPQPQIMPSWSKRPEPPVGQGVAPSPRRQAGSGNTSPVSPASPKHTAAAW